MLKIHASKALYKTVQCKLICLHGAKIEGLTGSTVRAGAKCSMKMYDITNVSQSHVI